ncbi:MAG: hypothetical protein GEV11_01885 [Streptosporangiales bacterium]|nr:hypothetical protein [Streptosporangiales bacterium]
MRRRCAGRGVRSGRTPPRPAPISPLPSPAASPPTPSSANCINEAAASDQPALPTRCATLTLLSVHDLGGDPHGDGHRLVFVGGLHRSGTTLLARCLAAHPEVSGFAGTGVPEDEGQHLQSVYPTARAYGGPGRFARHPGAHRTERHAADPGAEAAELLRQWRPHWDLRRPVLVEKSPPNLVMTRYLQALFPQARFVMVVRHPVTVTLATARWRRRSPLGRLFDNWFHGHALLTGDAERLSRLHVVRYERLVADPAAVLGEVGAFLGLGGTVPGDAVNPARSDRYRRQWEAMAGSSRPWRRLAHARLVHRYESAARAHGYSLADLDHLAPGTWPLPVDCRSCSAGATPKVPGGRDGAVRSASR